MNEIINRCLSLPREERMRLAEMLRDSLKSKSAKVRFDELLKVASELLGKGIDGKCRDASCVLGRMLIVYKMRQEGYSSPQIGIMLGRSHASVLHLQQRMDDVIMYPDIFKLEMAYWGMFNEKLRNYGI